MPLEAGSSQSVISGNIREMIAAGYPRRQAVAASLSNADRHPHRAVGGIGGPVQIPKFTVHAPMSPSQGVPSWTRNADRQMVAKPSGFGHFSGRFADGGGLPAASPWWEGASAKIADQAHYGGLIHGTAGGRTDQLPLSVPSGSHILPADTVSGMGQNDTANGAKNFLRAIRTGPYGVAPPATTHGHGVPSPPHAAPDVAGGVDPAKMMGLAHGGNVHATKTPILAAGGEFVVPLHDWLAHDPDTGDLHWHAGVKSIGDGDEKKGHQRLDAMIKRVREFNIKWLRTAPAPKK